MHRLDRGEHTCRRTETGEDNDWTGHHALRKNLFPASLPLGFERLYSEDPRFKVRLVDITVKIDNDGGSEITEGVRTGDDSHLVSAQVAECVRHGEIKIEREDSCHRPLAQQSGSDEVARIGLCVAKAVSWQLLDDSPLGSTFRPNRTCDRGEIIGIVAVSVVENAV